MTFHRRSLVWLLLLVPILLNLVLGLPVHTSLGGDDANFALRLTSQMSHLLQRGEWPGGWISEANNGYGAPTFYFYGFLASLISGALTTVLHLLPSVGLSVATGLFRIGAFVSCRVWLKQHASDEIADLGALLFASLPFTFLENPFVRCAVAEMLATALLPLLFYAVDRRLAGPWRIALIASVTSCLTITHLPQTALALLCLGFYSFVRGGWRAVLPCVAGGALGLAISGFFLYPALTLQPFINAAAWNGAANLDPRNQFLFDPHHLQLNRSRILSELCLHASWLIALCLWWRTAGGRWAQVLRSPVERAILTTLLVTLLGMTDIAWLAWTKIGFLHRLQFSWRLMPLCMLLASGASVLAMTRGRLKPGTLLGWTAMLVLVQLGIQVMAAAASRTLPLPLPSSVAHGLAVRLPTYAIWGQRDQPVWADPASDAPEYLPDTAVIAGWTLDIGSDRLQKSPPLGDRLPQPATYQRDGSTFLVHSDGKQSSSVVLPQFYFPGWTVWPVRPKAAIKNDASTGFVVVHLPAGSQLFTIRRATFPAVQVGRNISAAGLTALLGLFVVSFLAPQRKRTEL